MKGFSLVICCYNSASRISETLRHLCKLIIPESLSVEILLIDNCSTDDTQAVATQANEKYNHSGIEFRIIEEHQPGLTKARKRGIDESVYELIIFCDDDNHLDENYLEVAYRIFRENKSIGVAGGWNRPGFSIEKRPWIEDFFGAVAVEKLPRKEGVMNWVFGAGMIVSKEVINDIKSKGIQFLLTDRMGEKQTSGGDVELCLLARHLGYNVFYTPELQLVHHVSEERLQVKNFLKLRMENFQPAVHLFLIEGIMNRIDNGFLPLIFKFIKERFLRALLSIPRLITAKRLHLNLIEFYGNITLIFWVLLNLQKLSLTYQITRKNLYKSLEE